MSTPSAMAVGNGAMQQTSASPATVDDDNTGGIPRRPMRVKILYTFDDQNKSNCLARLPNALNIPVVSLDEDTQVGVIELKTCIQAIVVASPELTAKLGHDYTVYAYDFSEYENPLVGQGMLSWILASASNTPNAPAEDSQTMVTGRVCKNILGLFSNGIKETLEVKLKLIPVPTSMQKEYVENMERYHSLSQIMPEGFDYTAWSDFLKENPTLGQLAQPMPNTPSQHQYRLSTGGYEPFHQMLTRHSPSQEPLRNDSFYKQSNASFRSQPSRGSSPARSVSSFRHIPCNPEPRPSSRASVRSEVSTYSQQCAAEPQYIIEFQEDGPPKKRARITQATRPRNTPLLARNDSLHKTAATASSIWLHRPIASNPAASFADAEMQPRAPTPRPGNAAFGPRPPRRMPAPSSLRHGSMDGGRPYVSPYDAGAFSDAAVDSCDDERDGSPDETPRDIPSSPPIVGRPTSPTPSSPTLPIFPQLTDSGFVSDVVSNREEDNLEPVSKVLDGSDRINRKDAARDATKRRKQLARMEVAPYDQSHKPWQEVNPGPTERLPQTYVPPPRSFTRDPYKQIAQSIETDTCMARPSHVDPSRAVFPTLPGSQTIQDVSNIAAPTKRSRQLPTDSFPFPPIDQTSSAGKGGSPNSTFSHCSPESEVGEKVYSREATPSGTTQRPTTSKSRGLPRSHTWSGAAEPMSDAPTPSEPKAPRSGSHAKRKKYIREKLQSALATGDMPDHCHNCGEIETPTWRKPYTRIEYGTPEGIEISPAGIVAYEVIEPDPEKGEEPSYRIYKNKVTKAEKEANLYDTMNLCNPCGLYLVKNGRSRPQSFWDKAKNKDASKAPSRPRRAPSTRSKPQHQHQDIASDAAVPQSDSVFSEKQQAPDAGSENEGDKDMPPPSARPRALSNSNNNGATSQEDIRGSTEAEAALERAIQSSPSGFRRKKDASVEVDSDLTPRPTRRLLFPSPRKDGEVKTLDFAQVGPERPHATILHKGDSAPENPRCERCRRVKKLCDRQHPCGRCVAAGEECVPAKMRTSVYPRYPHQDGTGSVVETSASSLALPNTQNTLANTCGRADTSSMVAASPAAAIHLGGPATSVIDEGETEKENYPPAAQDKEHNDLSYLFETPAPAKVTPKKSTPKNYDALSELLKTPTPGSRRRLPLTPRRGMDDADQTTTPSRSIFTPRTLRLASTAPDTPFTRQLNAMLSDANNSSPSQVFDFSTFPVFDTPARASGAQFSDLFNDDFLSSDMPASSSPARAGMLGLGFDLYEDPSTSSVGLWTDQDMFSSDAMMLDVDNEAKGGSDTTDSASATTMLKMTVGGVTVDFASMIEEVVGNNEENVDVVGAEKAIPAMVETQPSPEVTEPQRDVVVKPQTSPEATSQGLAQTPEAPEED